MGFLAPAEKIVAQALAAALEPPLPPDISAWCERNIVFDERSPMPGPFNIERFSFLKEIHEVLSPEHPCREVTVRGSAQWGKTVSVLQPTLGAWFEYAALDALVVHPTQSAATEWVNNKWMPMRRQAPGLLEVFGSGRGANRDNVFNQETQNQNGSLKVASSGAPADLTGTSRRLVIMDDLSKFEMNDMGDPDSLAANRASGFEDAKIVRISTPMIKGTCRISRAYQRSDQRLYYVPCPHCGNEAPLTWENFKASIDPERLHAAHFTCEACGCEINHSHKEKMVRKGRWVPQNPNGNHPGFFLWRAYAPMRDWASIAIDYAQVMGWATGEARSQTEEEVRRQVESETEQTFYNDVLGLPFEQATSGPDWEVLRDRVEMMHGETYPIGVVPPHGVLLTAGVDCQDDRLEVQIVAFGRDRRRWTVAYIVIPHTIGSDEGRAALNSVLKHKYLTSLGLPIAIDMLAIDGGAYTDDVWSWAKRHPWSRVIIVKGSSTQNGPIILPMKFERRNDGRARRRQKRGFMVNVSQLKGNFYTWLKKEDPTERGFCQFAEGLKDEFYRQITAEVCVLKRQKSGVTTRQWELVEPTRRNEALDTMNYAEAAARRKGWASMTPEQWEALAAVRGVPPEDPQGDLFDKTLIAKDAEVQSEADKPKKPISEYMP